MSPRTLVHGDFGAKNVRLRTTPAGTEVVVLDWETAGWGAIAVDIPQTPQRAPRKPGKLPRWRGVSLDEYAANSSGAWDGVRRRDLAQLAAVGTVFRYVSSIHWAAEQVRSGGTFKPMARLRLYAEEFTPVVAALLRGDVE
jgi:aminoglycoside phosphotransferase (APT) family kinase protein